MARVFISYAHAEVKDADRIRNCIIRKGHSAFFDGDMYPGEPFEKRIRLELGSADAVVFVVTMSFAAAPWCAAEIGFANALERPLLPLMVDAGARAPLLEGLHHVSCDRRNSAHCCAWLAQELRRIDAGGGIGWAEGRSPFPGLKSLDAVESMAPVFFGRDAEIEELRRKCLRDGAGGGLLVVTGAPGCGKSSLVLAGLVARMSREREWEVARRIRPGMQPLRALVDQLEILGRGAELRGWTHEEIERKLGADDGLARLAEQLMAVGPQPKRQRLLLVVDQGEELFTRSGETARGRFVTLLRNAVDVGVWVVVTVAPKYTEQLLALPEWDGVHRTTYSVKPIARERLKEVIERPAETAGILVEPGLVDRLVADTGSGRALPMLALTLASLVSGLRRGDTMTLAAYLEKGGVQGALDRHADDALSKPLEGGGLAQRHRLNALLRVVTVDSTGQRTGRRADLGLLPASLRPVVDIFVDEGLLRVGSVEREDGSAGQWFGAAHDALLSWPPLARAIDANERALRASRSLEEAVAEWTANGRAPHYQLNGRRLTGIEEALDPPPDDSRDSVVDLTPAARQFIDEIHRRARRNHRLLLVSLSVVLAVVATAAGVTADRWVAAVAAHRATERQRRLAISRELVQEAIVLRDSQPRTSLALSIEAYDIAPDLRDARDNLLSVQAGYYDATLHGPGAVHAVAFSPDGHLLAAAEHSGAIRLWDMPTGRLRRDLPTGVPAYTVAFSPDGRLLAAAGQDGVVTVWDTRAFTRLARLHTDSGAVNAVAFSRDGALLAAGRQDGSVTLWRVRGTAPQAAAPVTSLPGGPGPVGPVNALAFGPDGHTLAVATATADGEIGITFWDLRSRRPSRMTGYTRPLRAVGFSPDGRRLATGSDGGVVTIWDMTSRAPLATSTGHQDAVRAVAFSPDGRTLASSGDDGAVRLWDAASRGQLTQLSALTGPTAPVAGVAFTPDGRILASAGSDGVVGLWNVSGPADGRQPEITNAAVAGPDGTLATAGRARVPLVWDTRYLLPVVRAELVGGAPTSGSPTASAFGMAITPTGTALAAPDPGGAVEWTLPAASPRADPVKVTLIRRLRGSGDGQATLHGVAFAGDRYLAGTTQDGAAQVWDLARGGPATSFPEVHSGPVDAVALGPTPTRAPPREADLLVATGGDDGQVATSRMAGTAQPLYGGYAGVPVHAVAFSPDGGALAAGSDDGSVKIWTLGRPDPRVTMSTNGRPVVAVSFSRDSTRLATASSDGVIRLWDVATGTPEATLTAHAGTRSVTFRPDGDGRTFVTADQDGTPDRWTVDPATVRRHICAVAAPTLTATEWATYVPDLPYRPVCRP